MPVADPGVTYGEVRSWIVWLQAFTVQDLADTMAVHPDVAARFVRAALWHGIIYDTEQTINGTGPPEPIYAYTPLPDTIYPRIKRTPPEKLVGYKQLFDIRGVPVRIRSEREHRKQMAGSPKARKVLKDQNRRYERYMEQVELRKRQQEERRQRKLQAGKKKWEV